MLEKIKAMLPSKPAHRLLFALFCLSVFFLGFLLTALGYTLFGIYKKNSAQTTSPDAFTYASPKPINNHNPEEGIYNVLLLGYGGGGHDGSLLTDSIIVAHVDTNTKKTALVSIPRDLWVPGSKKVNAAGTAGFQNMGPAVQNITGLPINYYVSVDFSGFTKIIDNLGGINVTVPNSFDDSFFPIPGEENNVCGYTEEQIFEFKNQYQGFELEKQFTCRYEGLHFEKGPANLDGQTTLKFVRSRHGDSDFGRSLRQFAVLEAIANKLISLKSLSKLDQTISTLFNMVKTDLDLGTIKSLVEVLSDASLYTKSQIQLSTENVLTQGVGSSGEFILTPKAGEFDFTEVKNYINSQLQ